MNTTEKTSQYPDNEQRVAVQTQVSGGVESDDRYFVFGNTIDEVLVMHDGTGDLYYAHDHLYSPIALLAANGTVAERYEYDVYGKVHILAPNYELRTASLYGNPYTFTGRELDILDAGSRTLMYYRARTYDPETGRFMQRDPLGTNNPVNHEFLFNPQKQYKDSLNLYEYVRSRPFSLLDPTGLTTKHFSGRLMWYFYDWTTKWEEGYAGQLDDYWYDFLFGRYSFTADETCIDDIIPNAEILTIDRELWTCRSGVGLRRTCGPWYPSGNVRIGFPVMPDIQISKKETPIGCINGGVATAIFYYAKLGYDWSIGIDFNIGGIDISAFATKAIDVHFSLITCCGCIPNQDHIERVKKRFMTPYTGYDTVAGERPIGSGM